MTIREVELKTGLERTNIRFYEREGLINPIRKENGYRDYSDEDLALLQKIKLLRRIGFSLDEIRSMKSGNTSLNEAICLRLDAVSVQRRELNAAEQICQEMQKDGAVFSTLDAEHYLCNYEKALSYSDSIRQTVPYSDRIEPVRCPWRRLFARTLDFALIRYTILSLLAVVFRVNVGNIPWIVEWIVGFASWGILIPIEGVLISRFGTTLGKWLMSIRVEHVDGRNLTFQEAADRAWQVFCQGEGFKIPFYALFRAWKSYRAVMEGNGPEWDKDAVLVVKESVWWKTAAYVGVQVLVIALSFYASLVPSVPMHRGTDLTVEQFVENYNQLAKYYGIESEQLLIDGTFKTRDIDPGMVVIDLHESEPVAFEFSVENGVLTRISFEREIVSPFLGINYDPVGQDVIRLSTMAYSWSNAGIWEARRSADIFKGLTSTTTEEGVWDKTLFGSHIYYSVTSLGESQNDNGASAGEKFKGVFYIERLPASDN